MCGRSWGSGGAGGGWTGWAPGPGPDTVSEEGKRWGARGGRTSGAQSRRLPRGLCSLTTARDGNPEGQRRVRVRPAPALPLSSSQAGG